MRIDVVPMRDQHSWVALGMGLFSLAFGLFLLVRGDGRPAPLQEPWRVQGVGALTFIAGAGLIVAGEMRARRTAGFEARWDRLSVLGRRSWARTDVADIEVRSTGETHVEDFTKSPVAGLYVRSTGGDQALLVKGKDPAALDWLARVLRTALRDRSPEGGCAVCGREAASAGCPDCDTWAPGH